MYSGVIIELSNKWRLFFYSRHWYTITCVQWIRSKINSIRFDYEDEGNIKKTYIDENYWVQIDSGFNSVHSFESKIDDANCVSKTYHVMKTITVASIKLE